MRVRVAAGTKYFPPRKFNYYKIACSVAGNRDWTAVRELLDNPTRVSFVDVAER